MKKLNNKGMTLIELLVSFVIVSAIVVSMFNVIMSYQTEEVSEASRTDIIAYKNMITKAIQTDIIKGELKSVTLNSITNDKRNDKTTYSFTLNFNKSVNYSTSTSIVHKNLIIVASDSKANSNYIIYTDVNKNGGIQEVRYNLPDIGSGCAYQEKDNCTNTVNAIKFTAITTNVTDLTNTKNKSGALDNNALNTAISYFDLDITISYVETGGDYHIKIIAPLNYAYCK